MAVLVQQKAFCAKPRILRMCRKSVVGISEFVDQSYSQKLKAEGSEEEQVVSRVREADLLMMDGPAKRDSLLAAWRKEAASYDFVWSCFAV